MLTTAQKATLKTYIDNDAGLTALRTAGNFGGIAAALNAPAAPVFVLWKTSVSSEIIGNAWVGTDIDAMSALNMQRLQLLLASSPAGVFDMTRADRRAGFENPFGTNVNNASRVAMRAAWKRNATVLEKLFATGTGSDASPATPGTGSSGYIEGELPATALYTLWG